MPGPEYKNNDKCVREAIQTLFEWLHYFSSVLLLQLVSLVKLKIDEALFVKWSVILNRFWVLFISKSENLYRIISAKL